ncbi:adenine phosphoribosyltransferase [Malaciobacter halophilus]|uniref:Adenine phosphoribosyltransferase n=1 Tax=Malaciobacter halophilus TaxID=197482 RepID=A0A2N1J5H8_9BACT|nr:adenine phosphoribosyltransferase [Malaciobacter halophilus]AXH09191.1 adenine phosphoribosyltransferase [Malaciobacter halophilus]PKI81827.1 adenine phosphoribosyltransferase [Malaciobacter halophilus]
MTELTQEEKQILLNAIRDVQDFPKEGIVFKDITTLLNDKNAFSLLMNHLEKRYKEYNLDYVAGIDSRGFIFGAALADRLNIGFVPVRKKGKLPSTTVCEKYELEYGFDEVEIHLDAFHGKTDAKVLLIDDLLATGGTANASAKLIKNVKANLVEACFLLNLTFLNGKQRVEQHTPVYTILDV